MKVIGITAGILPGLGIYEKGRSTLQGFPIEGWERPAMVAASLLFGGAWLTLSLPYDVISGAKFTAFARKSAEAGIARMFKKDENKWII